jgi:hypothetical protein
VDDSSRTELAPPFARTHGNVGVASTTRSTVCSGNPAVATLDRQATTVNRPQSAHDTSESSWSQRQTTVLLKIATALNEIGALDNLMLTVASAVASAMGVEFTSVYAYDETHTRTVASGTFGVPQYISDLSAVANLPPTDVPAEAEVIRTGRTLYRTPETSFPDLVWIGDT